MPLFSVDVAKHLQFVQINEKNTFSVCTSDTRMWRLNKWLTISDRNVAKQLKKKLDWGSLASNLGAAEEEKNDEAAAAGGRGVNALGGKCDTVACRRSACLTSQKKRLSVYYWFSLLNQSPSSECSVINGRHNFRFYWYNKVRGKNKLKNVVINQCE